MEYKDFKPGFFRLLTCVLFLFIYCSVHAQLLKTNQANCVDGTVVFASVLKRIGIKPVMVTVPGHCFLGYFTSDTTTTDIHFLETTMISSTAFIANTKAAVQKYADVLSKILPKGVKLSELNKAYYLEFFSAQIEGEKKFKSSMEKYGADYVKIRNVFQHIRYRILTLKYTCIYK